MLDRVSFTEPSNKNGYPGLEESLKYLLEAERRAQAHVDKAIAERDRLLDEAIAEARSSMAVEVVVTGA